MRVDGSALGGFIGGFAQPGGQESIEVAAFFSGKAAFFIRYCPEPIQKLIGILGSGGGRYQQVTFFTGIKDSFARV